MAKKRKPMWPILVTFILVGCSLGVVLHDWERYPDADEMERYLEAQHSDVQRVEVTEMRMLDEQYVEAQVYHLRYTYKNGKVEDHTHTVKKKDRKAVFPWHDYYADQYPQND